MFKRMRNRRILADVVIFLSFIFLPWWCTISLAIISIFVVRPFFEFALVGFFIDLTYGVSSQIFFGIPFFLTWFCLLALLLVDVFVRKYMRFEQPNVL